eukprot:COSAG04_NODE_3190_length_3070_cov_1.758667_6_plen_47_part_00
MLGSDILVHELLLILTLAFSSLRLPLLLVAYSVATALTSLGHTPIH